MDMNLNKLWEIVEDRGACCAVVSHVIPRTVACQTPLFTDSPGKNTEVGCHFLLQGIFSSQGLKMAFPYCRQTLYPLSHQGRPRQHIKKQRYYFADKAVVFPVVMYGC